MSDKYEALREALAAGPTPGPWYHGAKNGEHKYCVYDKVCWTDEYGRHGDTPNIVVHVSPDDGKFREAAYIAAADPTTIAALLAERDALAGEVERLRAQTGELSDLLKDAAVEIGSLAETHVGDDIDGYGRFLRGFVETIRSVTARKETP